MATWKLGPALAAGNTFVLKPSELTPLTALRLAEITADILPPGVFNVVTGQGETAGDALVRHPEVAMVSLTGDVATGKLIARTAADTLKRVHLELGGKAPVVVFDDADIEAVVATLTEMAYYNSGQDCTAPCRVHRRARRVRRPRRRPHRRGRRDRRPATRSTRTPRSGPVVSADQQARVARHGRPRRRRRRRGHGRRRTRSTGAGFFYEPSVVANPAQDSEIVQREVFGPVVSVQRFTDEDAGARVGQRRRLRPRRRACGRATSAGRCA